MQAWISESAVSHRLYVSLWISLLAHLLLVSLPFAGEANRTVTQVNETKRMQYRILARLAQEPLAPASLRGPAEGAQESPPAALSESQQARQTAARDNPVQGLGLALSAGPEYFAADQLSKRPAPIGDDPLDTVQLRLLAKSGKLLLKLWIDERGQVVEVQTEKSDLPAEFALAAAAAFRQIRFTPGERDGLPVASVIRIEVSYDDSRRSAS